jgi:hypothetical protein
MLFEEDTEKVEIMDNAPQLSSKSRARLEEQGFRGFADSELGQHRLGIRFAYFICMTIVILGLVLRNQPLLLLANVIALLGVLPPYHPLDYLYNYLVRHLMNRPKLPPRANQGRFACALATAMLAIINYYVYVGSYLVAYTVGGALLITAFLVTFLDLCIPSKIYNALFKRGAGRLPEKSHPAEAESGG